MKRQSRFFTFLLLLSLLFGAFASGGVAMAADAEQQVQFVAPIMIVNTSFLNIRTGPAVGYSILMTVVGGTELPVLGRASDGVWFQVSTPLGIGWINGQYAVPRGNFENIPTIRVEITNVPVLVVQPSVGLPPGQGGGGAVPVYTSPLPGQGGGVAFTAAATTPSGVSMGGAPQYAASITIEAVNLRTEPADNTTALGTLFRDDSKLYPIVGRTADRNDREWLLLAVPGMGTGWVESGKLRIRPLATTHSVIEVVADVVALLDSPNGNNDGRLPILTRGAEGFLLNISADSNFVQVQLTSGHIGWLPFSTVRTVANPGDQDELLGTALGPSAVGALPGGGIVGAPAIGGAVSTVPQGLAMPHIVINTSFLHIRSGPSADFTAIGTVRGGTELPVLGLYKDGVWFLVQSPFGQGWVNNEFVLFRGSIDNVPIIQTATGVLSTPIAVVNSALNLYPVPGTGSGAIGTIQGPAEYPVVARSADFQWVQLNTSIGFGWVSAAQVTIRGDTGLIPVVG